MNTIIFENKDHENRYNEYIEKMPRKDGFNKACAYLLTLIGHNPNDIFDFENHRIIPEGLGACWQTSNTARATALLFSLWCNYNDENNCGTVYNIFGSNYWDKYYIEALRLYCSDTISQIPPSLKINWKNTES